MLSDQTSGQHIFMFGLLSNGSFGLFLCFFLSGLLCFLCCKKIADLSEKENVFGSYGRSRRCGRCLFLKLADEADKEENAKCDEQEVNGGLEEVAVFHKDRFYLSGAFFKGEGKGGERNIGEEYAEAGHDNVVYKGGYNFTECAADDNTDCHVDNVALNGKIAEVFEKCGFLHKTNDLSFFAADFSG